MIFDTPYVLDTEITFIVDKDGRTIPVLVVRTCIEMPPHHEETHEMVDLFDLMGELKNMNDISHPEFRPAGLITSRYGTA